MPREVWGKYGWVGLISPKIRQHSGKTRLRLWWVRWIWTSISKVHWWSINWTWETGKTRRCATHSFQSFGSLSRNGGRATCWSTVLRVFPALLPCLSHTSCTNIRLPLKTVSSVSSLWPENAHAFSPTLASWFNWRSSKPIWASRMGLDFSIESENIWFYLLFDAFLDLFYYSSTPFWYETH